jgi:hypothetical protein
MMSIHPHFNLRTNNKIFIKCDINIMPLEAIPSFYFYFLQSVNLSTEWTNKVVLILALLLK